MKQYLQRLLGITQLTSKIETLERSIRELERVQYKLINAVHVSQAGLGRVIAKLDPMYGRSEFDPERVAESNRIGEEVLKKLFAEQAAMEKHNPRKGQ